MVNCFLIQKLVRIVYTKLKNNRELLFVYNYFGFVFFNKHIFLLVERNPGKEKRKFTLYS